jgi:hypothetical protein
MFQIFAIEDQREAGPWVVMECPVIVGTKEIMNVDVEEPVSRKQNPPLEIGFLIPTNHLVAGSSRDDKQRKVTEGSPGDPGHDPRLTAVVCPVMGIALHTDMTR